MKVNEIIIRADLRKFVVVFVTALVVSASFLAFRNFAQNETKTVDDAASRKMPSAASVYNRFKKDGERRDYNRLQTPHYGVATVTQRNGETGAIIKIALNSKDAPISGVKLEIQPVTRQLQNGLITSRTEDGEKTITGLRRPSEFAKEKYETEFEVRLAVGKTTNALEIKWIPEGTVNSTQMTFVVPLETAPQDNAFIIGAITDKKADLSENSENIIGEGAYCTWVWSGSPGGCPFISACCANNGEGSTVDTQRCVITCGTACPRQEVCQSGSES